MADVALADFLPDVLPAVDGCPRQTAIQALRQAAIEFCTRSWYDQRPVTGVIDADDALLTLASPAGFAVVAVISLRMVGRAEPLVPMTRYQMDASVPGWADDRGYLPSHFIHQSVNELLLWPAMAADAAAVNYTALLALKPARDGNDVGPDVYQDHYETLVAGALARLLRMPGKPWTDLKQAGISSEQFARGVLDAKVKVMNQFSNANTFVLRPTFGV